MLSGDSKSAKNGLFEALPVGVRKTVLAACETVPLVSGKTLNPKGRFSRIYFPTSGFISMMCSIKGPSSLEVGVIGNEGACGYQLVLGAENSTIRSIVGGTGSALCMETVNFNRQLLDSDPLAGIMQSYVNVQLNQLAQLVACTRFHVVEQRLARCLLMIQDRVQTDSFDLTQKILGSRLGVRRVGITKAAGALQERGLIGYGRGNITVLDRDGLIGASCACYAADHDSYARMMN